MSSTSSTPSTPVKRACDSCHRRKVKCIGEGTNPCKHCVSAGLICTYNAIPQKKGPKGSRAKVLSELRDTQRQTQLVPGPQFDVNVGRSVSPVLSKTPGLLSPDLVNACVDYFFANIYPTQPILHHGHVQQIVLSVDQSIEAYCQITALCAYTILQPDLVLPPSYAAQTETGRYSNAQLSHVLLDEAIRCSSAYDFHENPTILSVYTSFFVFGCYFSMDRQNAAWVYLRHALTLAHILDMHDEESYKSLDMMEATTRRRLFWVLYITERAYAFKRHRPLTLYPTIQLPRIDEDSTETVDLTGFIHLIKLYRPFNETFFGVWNRTTPGTVPSWLSQLQRQLSEALPMYLNTAETQAVDLRISQQWLKTMVWQLAISHGFISSIASDNTLSFRYPIDISRDLVEMSNEFSQHAMEIHGVGLAEKLFDVACTLTDVMAYVPMEQSAYEPGPRDYLSRLINLLSGLRSAQRRYLPNLLEKVHEVLPNMTLPMLRSLPSAAPNIRVDDIYGSSGSTPGSHSESGYASPPAMSMRHDNTSNIQNYSDVPASIHSQMAGHPPISGSSPMAGSVYSNFTPSMDFQQIGTTSAPTQLGQTAYQTHLPPRSMYPS